MYALLLYFHLSFFYRTTLITMFNTLMSHPVNIRNYYYYNHKSNQNYYNHNFLSCDWFSTNSLAKLLSDSLLLDSLLSDNHIQSCSLNQLISISEWHETIYFSFVSILMQNLSFFHSLAILRFTEIVIL